MPAGVGDIVTGLLAIPVAYFCYRQTPWSRTAALAWNTLGLAELLMLIPLGILSSPSRIQFLSLEAPNHLTSSWPSVLAPTFHVPLGILLHIFSFVLLWSQADEAKARAGAPGFGWQLMLVSAIVVSVYAILFYVAAPLLTDRPIAFQIYPGIQQALAAHPVGLYIHIIPAVLALLLGPFQFWEGFRARHWRRHRLLGRIYLFGGVLFGGLAALYIAQFSFAGWGSRLGFSVQAILLLFTGYMAYRHIRRREIDTHREWMMRNYALIFGAVTLRLNIRLFFWLGLTLPEFHAINAWLCWIPNLLVAEWLIQRLRARRSGQGRPLATPELRPSGD